MSCVGEQLRTAREKSGLTIQQVAESLKLKQDQIIGLEMGDYTVFPAPVYAFGSMRSYATLLKLDPAPLAAAMKKEMAGNSSISAAPSAPSIPEIISSSTENNGDFSPNQSSKLTWRLTLVWKVVLPLGLFLLLMIGGIWAYNLWRSYEGKDPLITLGPGYYEGSTQYEQDMPETLPLPPVN